MFENLATREVLTVVVGFVALALVGVATPFIWFVLPWIRWRRDQHLTPKAGEVWRRSSPGDAYHVNASADRAGGIVVRLGGDVVFRGGDGSAKEWRAFARKRLLYRAKEGGRSPVHDQPPPLPRESTAIWDLVIADMRDRDQLGRERYGTPLQAFNGRDAMVDLYQELLDAVAYVRQVIAEKDGPAEQGMTCCYCGQKLVIKKKAE